MGPILKDRTQWPGSFMCTYMVMRSCSLCYLWNCSLFKDIYEKVGIFTLPPKKLMKMLIELGTRTIYNLRSDTYISGIVLL